MAEVTARVGFSNFIAAAERSGLPVGFLRRIGQSNYGFSYGESSYVLLSRDLIVLQKGDLERGANLAPPLPSESSQLATLYHESTHAWLDLAKNESAVTKLFDEGRMHYEAAPLKNGAKADDPERLFHEAMGVYVGHRVAVYWQALETLTYLETASRRKEVDRPYLVQLARAARARYARDMAKRVFGYQPPPGRFWSREQVETTRVIFNAMKGFCDRVLLEDKISDQFERQPALMELWAKLQEQFPELR
jgi:hypothetical protein